MHHTFFCVDGHTCGNPVRLVVGGQPMLHGETMAACRADFVERLDWIRRALMFEPRGHDVMSGALFCHARHPEAEMGLVFIETSGCLPMCGHGTIGAVTIALEQGLVTPREPGRLVLEVPAGLVVAEYRMDGRFVEAVRIRNVPSYLHASGVAIDGEGLGRLTLDIAYGGNFYAIIEPQPGFPGLEGVSASDLLRWSPMVRRLVNEQLLVRHPIDGWIAGVSHVLWTGRPGEGADGRNAVFYGERAIDRSPCGTGTSARMAQLAARGLLGPGDSFVHESIIGSRFTGRIEGLTSVGPHPAILPSIEGWARVTGLNTILVDDRDPFAYGFQVS